MMPILVLISFFLTTFQVEDHAIYISTIEIEEVSGSLPDKMTCKVFQDDLRDAMRLSFGKAEAYSGHYSEMMMNLSEYINDRVRLDVNGTRLPLQIELVEEINDIVKIDLTFQALDKWKNVNMDVRLLTEVFADQNNIVVIHGLEDSKSYRLNKKTTELRWMP